MNIRDLILVGSLLVSGSALACNGVFDPQTGICHQSGGYQIPGQLNGQAQPRDYWGAIAIDVVNGNTSGSSWGELNRNEAAKKALNSCNDSRVCKVVFTFKNSCAAMAVNGINIDTATAASDINPTVAERKALAACNKKSNTPCHVWIKATCSGVGY